MSAAAPTAPATPRPGLGIGPDGSYTRGGQIAAFLLGLWAMIVFLPLLVVGAMLYTRAEEIYPTDPGRASSLVTWSWVSISVFPPLAAGLVGAIGFAVSMIV
ncbi:hypothetical protein [Actinomadura rudentiformis]|uniref:hypothetical protein n=1 Tax=Actinomadura rudentiformis TaxID=359158 RepID=UPI00178C6392|nr:hypothetical protein [Actinomadura rudentiformis]